MNENETTSWIFLATALASEQEPANVESISQIADGINHAVPTHKELQISLSWLTKNGLIGRVDKKYYLTKLGTETIEKSEAQTNNIILNIWSELTKEIENTKSRQQL